MCFIDENFMPECVEILDNVYKYNSNFFPFKQTIVTKFSNSPKLVLSRELG